MSCLLCRVLFCDMSCWWFPIASNKTPVHVSVLHSSFLLMYFRSKAIRFVNPHMPFIVNFFFANVISGPLQSLVPALLYIRICLIVPVLFFLYSSSYLSGLQTQNQNPILIPSHSPRQTLVFYGYLMIFICSLLIFVFYVLCLLV